MNEKEQKERLERILYDIGELKSIIAKAREEGSEQLAIIETNMGKSAQAILKELNKMEKECKKLLK
ncbi:MAG: hypothetical protein DRP18_04995 [Candidatus Aenigmatarchaeota archaeon]|nr:MAG: hypothetical protein DRP18_04995 [Candidatus Aenigmarchaeota archaeon]